jgi:Protein of unknown function (DUF1236)
MKTRIAVSVAAGVMALIWYAGMEHAGAQATDPGSAPSSLSSSEQNLVLTQAQRRAIYAAAMRDRIKPPQRRFPAEIGAEVPPMIELNPLPDEAVAGNPTAKFYEYTMVQDRVVLVDPTKMRVIDVIGPNP